MQPVGGFCLVFCQFSPKFQQQNHTLGLEDCGKTYGFFCIKTKQLKQPLFISRMSQSWGRLQHFFHCLYAATALFGRQACALTLGEEQCQTFPFFTCVINMKDVLEQRTRRAIVTHSHHDLVALDTHTHKGQFISRSRDQLCHICWPRLGSHDDVYVFV